MTNPEIPEEAVEAACVAMNGGATHAHHRERWEPEVRTILTAALPHLRVQETPRKAFDVGYNIVNQLADLWEVPVEVRQATNDRCWEFAAELVASAAPHPRPVVDREAIWRALYDVWQNPKERPIDFASEGVDAVLALLPTEEETKALAEVATKLGEAIGRKAAGEEIAARFLADARRFEDDRSNFTVAQHYARVARYVVSQPSDGPSEPLTAHTGHSDLPEGGEGL